MFRVWSSGRFRRLSANSTDVVALFDLLVLGGAAAAGAEMPEEARAVLEELQERFKNVESPRAELLARLEALVEDDGWRFERERVRGG